MKLLKKLSLVLAIIVLVMAGILVIIFVFCNSVVLISSKDPNSIFANLPSDEQLIQNFEQHRGEFDELAKMLIVEKRLLVVFPESDKCQIADQKLVLAADDPQCLQYVNMFKDLGLEWAYSGHEPLWLSVASSGLSVSGSTKGYYFSSLGLPSYGVIVDNTEANDVKGQLIFRHIEGYWYIFIDH